MTPRRQYGPAPKADALRRNREHNRQRLAEWRAANPEQHQATRRRNEASRADRYRADPAYYLWRTARSRAKQNDVPFDIEPADVVVPAVCPITLEPINVLTSNTRTGASLDRVVNELGYVKGNVRVISRRANRLKDDATLAEVERIASYMRGEL